MVKKVLAEWRVVFGWVLMINLAMTLAPGKTLSQTYRKVAVLPFSVFSQESVRYLQTEIPDILEKSLKQEGAEVVPVDMPPDDAWRMMLDHPDLVGQYGRKQGADAGIWGSLTCPAGVWASCAATGPWSVRWRA